VPFSDQKPRQLPHKATTEFFDLDKPVIAAVNGLAFGGGFELALACDLIVAVEGVEFALPESGLGLVANAGGVQRLPRRIAPALAMELLLTGRRVGAEEALRLGLVNRLAPLGSLMSAARDYATTIAAKAPLATRAAKALARAGEGLSVEATFAAMRSGRVAVYQELLASDDAREGPRAFVEKRPPAWTGR
jgi:crotonobetainyl-CoA hydratase